MKPIFGFASEGKNSVYLTYFLNVSEQCWTSLYLS